MMILYVRLFVSKNTFYIDTDLFGELEAKFFSFRLQTNRIRSIVLPKRLFRRECQAELVY